MRQLILYLFVLMSLSSCLSTKKFRDTTHPPLTEQNIGDINGNYDKQAFAYFKYFGQKRIKSAEYMRLTAIDASTLDAKLMSGNQVLVQKKVKGHINDDGYFSIRRKRII